jgi:outer membrane biosynthesis protein TonB
VAKAPTRAINASGGELSREAIQKVVSEHMHEVQACYERQLNTNPGMSGKIVFDWVITPSGSVGTARQVSSSMRSPAVASCVLGLIRTWRFPQPVGGSVNVRYPFVFRVQGF